MPANTAGQRRPTPDAHGTTVDYLPPAKLLEEVAKAGEKKARLSVADLLLRGFLSGVFLAYATSFAYKVSDGFDGGAAALVSGAVFPVGFALIVRMAVGSCSCAAVAPQIWLCPCTPDHPCASTTR